MATKGGNQKNRTADPMRTKNGKERLGPLNIDQLEKLLSGSRKKNQAKIIRRIGVLKKRPGYVAPVVEAPPVEVQPEIQIED
jgi:hypothetical protein